MEHNITTIKKIMKDFSQNPNSSSENLQRVVGESEITAYEVLYLFDHLLGMKVEFMPIEKIAFIINLQYRNIDTAFELCKFGLNIKMREVENQKNIYDEMIATLTKAIELSQKEFQKDAEESIKKRNIILPNYTNRFLIALEYLEKQIEFNLTNSNDWPKNVNRADCYINSYSIHVISYIEHILSLLYPFSDYYDTQKNIKCFINKHLVDKIDCILSNQISENILIKEKITQVAKYIRNPIAHGYLTRNYFCEVQIPKLGYIPNVFQ